jgi:hypothetical protein
MHENSILLFQQFALPLFADGMKILEVGPDAFTSTYRKMVSGSNLARDKLDIYDSPKLTYPRSDVYRFPVAENQYDIVLSGQVIEHVGRIWHWMAELARITKRRGLIITINPVSQPYHEAPIDCWRIYPEGMKALCEEACLVVERSFWGSLESPKVRHVIPGRSLQHQPKIHRIFSPILGRLGGRVEKAFDTITVARKPARPRQP